MSSTQGLGDMVRTLLEQRYALKKEELGADARLSKKGMIFETEAYEIPDLGHFCILRMNAFLGLMKMETAVLAADAKDLPLLNLIPRRCWRSSTRSAAATTTCPRRRPRARTGTTRSSTPAPTTRPARS